MAMDSLLQRLRGWLSRGEGAPSGDGLTPLERTIYNEGERLIPGLTHGAREVVRHTSSYAFFRMVIEADLAFGKDIRGRGGIGIVDLGCGVGHGCRTLSAIQEARITGVDVSPECIEYARSRYSADNVTYRAADLSGYIPGMPEFDYVVSRGVMEHLPEGLSLILGTRWRNRLLFDVPYDEPAEANVHHVLMGIREADLSGFADAELFYQDLDGVIYDAARKPYRPNMIACVCTRTGLPRVADIPLVFPVPAWRPDREAASPK
ncbi:MAG TPA: class I SAM-dependent methyltransferase [Deltaproteobacteria bacterium]|nr:class I SAM-dependent methyltransferase [Deltaproteobacteria bacterium]